MTARIAEDDKKEYANKECDGRNVMENLIFSLNATIPIFLVMVAGYVFRQMKIVDDGFVKTLNSFNYKITLPVLLITDIAEADFYAVWDTTFVVFCFGVTLVCILCLQCSLLRRNLFWVNLFRHPTEAAQQFSE